MNIAETSEARQLLHPKSRMNRKDANRRSWATQPIEAIGRPSGVQRVDLRVRWLGRMEFADALVLQEELLARKREDRSLEDAERRINRACLTQCICRTHFL